MKDRVIFWCGRLLLIATLTHPCHSIPNHAASFYPDSPYTLKYGADKLGGRDGKVPADQGRPSRNTCSCTGTYEHEHGLKRVLSTHNLVADLARIELQVRCSRNVPA